MSTFVLSVCGDKHAERLDLSLKALKKYTKNDIIVVTSRVGIPIHHDQVVKYGADPKLNDVQCSRVLKTGLHRMIGDLDGIYCYLDTDVFPVSHNAPEIFSLYKPPITFGRDPGKTVKRFSRYATRKVPLNKAIKDQFKIEVNNDWPIWNGGVFLFDQQSAQFLDDWHHHTTSIFGDRHWADRDQGTLIATVWKHKLQNHYTLPREFNWLHKLQGGLRPNEHGFHVKNGGEVKFLHFPVSYASPSSQSWANLIRILDE